MCVDVLKDMRYLFMKTVYKNKMKFYLKLTTKLEKINV